MSRNLVPVLCDEWIDPELVHYELSSHHAHSFWLDAGPGASEGWSWVGVGIPESDLEAVDRVPISVAAAESIVQADSGSFRGGWIGWLSFDDAAHAAGAPAASDTSGVPARLWLRVTRFFAFDHARRRVWAFSDDEHSAVVDDLARAANSGPRAVSAPTAREATSRHTAQEYAGLIEQCREAIGRGDAYQLCLTTRFALESRLTSDVRDVYSRLRATTPSHHGGLMMSDGFALASATPERFLQVSDAVVRTSPIKGTRPRGESPELDAALARELLASEKERAENVMIVDLMRNDLSKVCDAGSVAVEELLNVETYAAVHQLVSTVSGRLRAGCTTGELLSAAFPAGSMTGAPKLSAMTILHGLESGPRGLFAGCFGWVGDDGSLDLAMIIRSIVVHDGGAYVGAGGGITWRSDAAAEVAEVGIKARGPLAALGAILPPGWSRVAWE
ncbi:anthranilate synthase component I family protein (plasmid) [Coraliomargarita sp. W4R53]